MSYGEQNTRLVSLTKMPKILPLKPAGDLKGTPKRANVRSRETMETYPTITTAKTPYSLWTFTDGRRLGNEEVTYKGWIDK